MEYTEDLKVRITLAAITAAGPGASDADIAGQVVRICGFMETGSPVLSAFGRAKKRAESTSGTGVIDGTVVYVDLEETSKRVFVVLKTTPSNDYPDGLEPIRTDRTDSRDYADAVRALTTEANGLIGHRVLANKRLEKQSDGGGRDIRVLTALQDRGLDPDCGDGFTNDDGAAMVPWSKKPWSDIAPKLRRLNRQPA